MKSYRTEKNQPFSTTSVQWQNNDDDPPKAELVTTTTVEMKKILETNFTVFKDNKGDFKTPTPHSYGKLVENYGRGSLTYSAPDGSKTTFSGPQLAGFAPFPESSFDLAYNKAVEKLYDQMRAGVDLSVDLAQSGQVLRMVKAVTKLRKFARSLRDPASTWLQYQYGWRPLVSTIYESGGVLSRQLERRALRRVEATGKDVVEYHRIVRPNANVLDVDTGLSITRCKIGIDVEIRDSFYRTLGDYTSLNPASIAWELVPYSFVVDWCVDVGGYLRSMESALLYSDTFRGGYVTQTKLETAARTRSYYGKLGNETVAGNAGSHKSYRFLDRQALGAMPMPRLPVPRVKLGTERFFSAVALLSAAFRR